MSQGMTPEQMQRLGERISKLGKDVLLEDMMGALGLVMYSCLDQFPPERRLQALAAWCGALFRQVAAAEAKRHTN